MAEDGSGDHSGHYPTGSVLSQRLFPVSGQNIMIEQYPLVSGSSQHIPFSQAGNNDGSFHPNFHPSNTGQNVYSVGSNYVDSDFMSQPSNNMQANNATQQLIHSQQQQNEAQRHHQQQQAIQASQHIQNQQRLQQQQHQLQQHQLQQQQLQQHQNQQQQQHHLLTPENQNKSSMNSSIDNSNQTGTNTKSNDSSDEDIHQCGRCKEIFHDVTIYLKHKSSKMCKTGKGKSSAEQTPVKQQQLQQQQNTGTVADNQQSASIDNKQQSASSNNSSTISDEASETASSTNQNILEAAAKNTIFRDSFISMANQPADGLEKPASNDEGDNYNNEFWSKDKQQSDVIMPSEDLAETGKKRRGRPPKDYSVENEPLDSLDSPPKAKRKSRPPRRHKPHYDPRDEASSQGSGGPNEAGPSGAQSSSFYGYPARSRGRGRGRHSSHRCPICMLLFPSRMTMIEHKRKHTKTHKCKICNEGFYTEDRLEKHVTKETHSYPCDQCERSYVNKQSLVRHKLSHSEKTHKCDQCSRAFKTARELKIHVEGMHALSRDFVCDVCNKAFSRPEKLKRHLMIHAPDRPVYTCPFKNHVGCDKTFYRKDKLTRHLYSHSKVKPFKCDQCDKSFARTDNLREHIRSHTGVFRYYCTVCGKGQPGPKKFLQHMLKQHNVENADIPCPYDSAAPETLVEQHKAVVEAETAARLARAATNMKKERDKKVRKENIETSEIPLDGHVAIANLNSMTLQSALLHPSSPSQQNITANVTSDQQALVAASRGNIESLYTINHSSQQQGGSGSPQFQISRANQETLVRNEQLLREHLVTVARDSSNAHGSAADVSTESRIQEAISRQLTENAAQGRIELDDPQGTTIAMTVDADGNITTSSRGLQLLSQGVLPGQLAGQLQFTTLLNSDIIAIGEDVIRQNRLPAMFQQKFGPAQ